MGNASSMLTQYDIEEVQDRCNNLSDEFLSIPEFAMNPLTRLRLLKMVDGLNFGDFVAFLSAFDAKTKSSKQQKIEYCNGKASFNDILEALRDLSGPFMSNEQRETLLVYFFPREFYLLLDEFIKSVRMHIQFQIDCTDSKFPTFE
ncbi:hypothetical protein ACJRO7_019799 [Eucalyptus globulus]|uniref:Uncharacterized protein n=1 Tax=Eucalyptus globulus TaxID=34317 RepID=A0ABD3KGM8_EUCGL